jgi:hypothetical protein
MKSMVVWSLKPGASLSEAVRRFLAGEAGPQEGQKILGRWHSVDMSIGFTLTESDTPSAHYVAASKFADIMDLRTYIVLEDNDVAPILASMGKK